MFEDKNEEKNIDGFIVQNYYICDDEHRLVIDNEFAIPGKKSSIKIRGQSDPGTPEEITKLYNSINTFRDLKKFFNTQPYVRHWRI